jgi:hypothetical protein
MFSVGDNQMAFASGVGTPVAEGIGVVMGKSAMMLVPLPVVYPEHVAG